ncbi:tRNA uridine 5-carboxymethylaminomethyl modification enzyme MnmG [Striga asiatica]|uniref:tRNA uridine 5-carboxymethylaminomethyl modification enzyme MnmG n=1 Tax=Striga asiatica TaxID=4170 RepID=A0A5A7QRE7_STRAF|nr:tRNA uridine 5-carboxymethylaminomethyl modification enzyme MnmG [Striga asiatica]
MAALDSGSSTAPEIDGSGVISSVGLTAAMPSGDVERTTIKKVHMFTEAVVIRPDHGEQQEYMDKKIETGPRLERKHQGAKPQQQRQEDNKADVYWKAQSWNPSQNT